MTEVRELSEFNSVDLRSFGRVVLTGGEKQKVEVEAEEDLLARVRTEVQGGVLVVGLRWWLGALLRMPELNEVQVRVTVPMLRSVKLSGAGQVRSEGALSAEDLELQLSGAGRLALEVKARRVETRLSGAGAVRAERLATRRVRIQASGAGECRVQASETLEVELSGAGSVRYLGKPRIESRITGVGRLFPID